MELWVERTTFNRRKPNDSGRDVLSCVVTYPYPAKNITDLASCRETLFRVESALDKTNRGFLTTTRSANPGLAWCNTKRRRATPRRPGKKATPSSNRKVELRAATARAGFGELAPVRFFRWPTPRRLKKAGPVLPLLQERWIVTSKAGGSAPKHRAATFCRKNDRGLPWVF